MSDPAKTRFAPSPTGHLHVGGARTALFNWALAGRLGGSFLLRIEDTDQARSSHEATSGILEDLAWLGILWDEGPETPGAGGDPGKVGPFYQSERLSHYQAAVSKLIEADLAYPAFESPEELDAMRSAAREAKQNFRFRRPTDFDRERALSRMETEPYVVRFRMRESGLRVVDEVLGGVDFGEEHLDDFVIQKRDGFPTYHLAVVVDDALMGVTHVLRGQEHLNNTPKHVALQEALGVPVPCYLHVPLIFNADGSKMSKRDKDKAARAAYKAALKNEPEDWQNDLPVAPERLAKWAKDKRSQLETAELVALAERLALALPEIEVEDFRRAGYLPETLCNFLALLGFSPNAKDADGKDLERFDREFLREHFESERIGRSNARFDRDKLLAFSADDIAALAPEDFLACWQAWASRYASWVSERFSAEEQEQIARALQSRCKTLADVTHPNGPGGFLYAEDEALDFDEKAANKFLLKGEPNGLLQLREVREVLSELRVFDAAGIEDTVKAFCEKREIGMGKVAQPLRVALTGSSASPPLGDTLALLGQQRVLRRIDRCLDHFA